MRAIKLGFWAVFTLAVIVISVTFVNGNDQKISLNFMEFVSSPIPLWSIMALSVVAGFILATIFFIIEVIVLKTKNVRLLRANKKLERMIPAEEAVSAVEEASSMDDLTPSV